MVSVFLVHSKGVYSSFCFDFRRQVFQINRLPPNLNRIQTVELLWSYSYLKVLVVLGASAGSIIRY